MLTPCAPFGRSTLGFSGHKRARTQVLRVCRLAGLGSGAFKVAVRFAERNGDQWTGARHSTPQSRSSAVASPRIYSKRRSAPASNASWPASLRPPVSALGRNPGPQGQVDDRALEVRPVGQSGARLRGHHARRAQRADASARFSYENTTLSMVPWLPGGRQGRIERASEVEPVGATPPGELVRAHEAVTAAATAPPTIPGGGVAATRPRTSQRAELRAPGWIVAGDRRLGDRRSAGAAPPWHTKRPRGHRPRLPVIVVAHLRRRI